MSYTPTNWQTGDTITAEKLNNMESGIENANEPFLVTLTPTAADFSGTMDKTVGEINAAYEAGQRIMFRMYTAAASHLDMFGNAVFYADGYRYPSFNNFIVTDSNALIYAYTGTTEDGTKNTYSTIIYPLTPMT